MQKVNKKIYSAWRRSEAYSVPVTEEGQQKAMERLKQFAVGYHYGVAAAAAKLEGMHAQNKRQHSFYLNASRQVRVITQEEEEINIK